MNPCPIDDLARAWSQHVGVGFEQPPICILLLTMLTAPMPLPEDVEGELELTGDLFADLLGGLRAAVSLLRQGETGPRYEVKVNVRDLLMLEDRIAAIFALRTRARVRDDLETTQTGGQS
jgi:hypothetical protein